MQALAAGADLVDLDDEVRGVRANVGENDSLKDRAMLLAFLRFDRKVLEQLRERPRQGFYCRWIDGVRGKLGEHKFNDALAQLQRLGFWHAQQA